MDRRESTTTDLRAQLNHALRTGQTGEALELYELIEVRRQDEPRWSHRKGDLLLRMGRIAEAVSAYQRAANLYAAQGFEMRAAATARLISTIDPGKSDVLRPVEPTLERRHR